MRENLLGYLLEALEPSERDEVEHSLENDPRLRHELELLDRSLEPLRGEKAYYDPPVGLARRTCEFVVSQAAVMLAPPPVEAGRSRWSTPDYVTAAGIFIAASMLFFPALNHSRYSARLAGCQNNLRQVGAALTNYANRHGGYFPPVETQGNLAFAGIQAPRLVQDQYLDAKALVCPWSVGSRDRAFRVPLVSEIEAANGDDLATYRREVAGDYGFPLGYVDENGRYHTQKNQGRANFALVADAPELNCQDRSSQNHAGSGQNVLFEAGNVRHLLKCKLEGCKDNIFANDRDELGPGAHSNDAVIVPSWVSPVTVELAR